MEVASGPRVVNVDFIGDDLRKGAIKKRCNNGSVWELNKFWSRSPKKKPYAPCRQ